MLYEFIVRVPVHTVSMPGDTGTTRVPAVPTCLWHQTIGEEYDDHQLIQARFNAVPECNENYWVSVAELLEENLDLAHLHGITEGLPSPFQRTLEQVKAEQTAVIKEQVSKAIESQWPQHKQLQVLLGLGEDQDIDQCREFIRNVVNAGKEAQSQIQQAKTASAAYRVRVAVNTDAAG